MLTHRAYRYELDPNKEQRILLAKHAGAARFAYNWGLARRIALWEQDRKQTNAIAQHKELNAMKKTDYPWMYEVSECAPQEALRNLDNAFKHFFEGRKAGRKVGFPRFKKKGRNDSFRLTGHIHVFERHVQLPRLGTIRLKEVSSVEGRILSATMRREADRWFVSVAVELERPDPAPVDGPTVGIDVGLTAFATLSTGEKVEAPKPMAKHLRRLKRLSRSLSRKEKGSKNRKKAQLRLARLHRRIRNIRQDFLHKFTTSLAKTKSVIVLEDLNVKGMMRNHNLARSIGDVAWSETRRQLSYKTVWYGSRLALADRWYPSSKTCHDCGYKMDKMPLSVREWTCPKCGVVHDRDENAAQNLADLAS